MAVDPIERLTLELARLPGIGERTAARLAHHVVKMSQRQEGSMARDLAAALTEVAEQVGLCERCQTFTATGECATCRDPRREAELLCVVESVADQRAIERSGVYRGRYHVLHGAIAPLDGIGPEDLKLDQLLARVTTEGFTEVVLATNADVDGDATALYLARLLRPTGVRLTRPASGVPLGGELEYLDLATVGRALRERRTV